MFSQGLLFAESASEYCFQAQGLFLGHKLPPVYPGLCHFLSGGLTGLLCTRGGCEDTYSSCFTGVPESQILGASVTPAF